MRVRTFKWVINHKIDKRFWTFWIILRNHFTGTSILFVISYFWSLWSQYNFVKSVGLRVRCTLSFCNYFCRKLIQQLPKRLAETNERRVEKLATLLENELVDPGNAKSVQFRKNCEDHIFGKVETRKVLEDRGKKATAVLDNTKDDPYFALRCKKLRLFSPKSDPDKRVTNPQFWKWTPVNRLLFSKTEFVWGGNLNAGDTWLGWCDIFSEHCHWKKRLCDVWRSSHCEDGFHTVITAKHLNSLRKSDKKNISEMIDSLEIFFKS